MGLGKWLVRDRFCDRAIRGACRGLASRGATARRVADRRAAERRITNWSITNKRVGRWGGCPVRSRVRWVHGASIPLIRAGQRRQLPPPGQGGSPLSPRDRAPIGQVDDRWQTGPGRGRDKRQKLQNLDDLSPSQAIAFPGGQPPTGREISGAWGAQVRRGVDVGSLPVSTGRA